MLERLEHCYEAAHDSAESQKGYRRQRGTTADNQMTTPSHVVAKLLLLVERCCCQVRLQRVYQALLC
jgi:hypothetical protein